MQCKCTGLTKYANVSAYIPTYTDLVRPQSVHKISETNSSFRVKDRTARKV